ncbi:GntR family transcriptional regulator [Mesorhizobium sp. M7A.F.Ca.US.006.01.1.1]|uniref:GntR family transcriptional regulator n=1 Tax=Mesorhizobium sp. M7A.F.Ca.US.006.01.1.1 TaxID=2496707 RepID=UPI001FDEA41F|nr:GntR family transcriptional regulator [Mesorhizobium sp. M7A.F.Ca.US.006.01.1.1]
MARSASSGKVSEDGNISQSAATIVADALRVNILHHTLEGGERLRQDAIAARFGVSQMIVREAFKQLASEGFLKLEPRRGVSVAVMGADEAWEITQLRSLIEAEALQWAIPEMTQDDLAQARRILVELDKAKSIDKIILLNARFHETLYSPCKRERTLSLIATLRTNFERYLRFTWQETLHREQSQLEHWDILTLCEKKDSHRAAAALKKHISATGDLLAERLRSDTR